MILPILAYGDPILKKPAKEVDKDHPNLDGLIEDMFETMYAASGVGLAAPQIGESLRLFIVDATPFGEDTDDPDALKVKDFKEVFINPQIIEKGGEPWPFEEGCLSIPNIREEVVRDEVIKIRYYDADWNLKEKEFDGYAARIIQHEYDHIEGVLFTDKLNPLKRRMLKRKLNEISMGTTKVDYKMRFPKLKIKR